eukprot:2199182-Pleurochrysis_carterae.AAC.1
MSVRVRHRHGGFGHPSRDGHALPREQRPKLHPRLFPQHHHRQGAHKRRRATNEACIRLTRVDALGFAHAVRVPHLCEQMSGSPLS